MDSLSSFAFDLTVLSIPFDASLVEIFCTSQLASWDRNKSLSKDRISGTHLPLGEFTIARCTSEKVIKLLHRVICSVELCCQLVFFHPTFGFA